MTTSTETPTMNSTMLTRLTATGLPFLALAVLTAALSLQAGKDRPAKDPAPELPSPICDSVAVPDGNRVSAHVYAAGVQIYQWNGSAWVFVAPEAELFASPCYEGSVGMHYAGPTWEAKDGSQVVAVREAGCAPYPGAIPWLRLVATETSEHGRFGDVTFIQRVNTIGGTAPAEAGTEIGQEARVPYTAEYYFYRAARH
jgi:hypothetical protein